MTWAQTEAELRKDGFSDEEILGEKRKERQSLIDDGFSDEEADKELGYKNPDFSKVKSYLQENYKNNVEGSTAETKDFFDFFERVVLGKNISEEKVTLSDAFKEGAQESALVMQYKSFHGDSVLNTDTMPPEYFDVFDGAAKMAGRLSGDLPYMIAGAAAGGLAATAAIASAPVTIPVGIATAATVFAAGAGANALPQSIRSYLTEFYEKGEIESFKDFWTRLSAATVDVGYEAAVGGATEVVGGKVAGAVAKKGAGYIAQRAAGFSSELATMSAMNFAATGEVPDAKEFGAAAVLVAGLGGSTYVSKKMFKIYSETGVRPAMVAEVAKNDPLFMEQLMANTDDLPDAVKSMVESKAARTQRTEDVFSEAAESQAVAAKNKIRDAIGIKEDSTAKEFLNDIVKIRNQEDASMYGKKWMHGPVSKAKEMYSRYASRYYPIRAVSEKGFEGYKLQSGVSGIVETFVNSHTFDFDDTFANKKATGEGLQQIINDVADPREFEEFLVANRVKELRAKGKMQVSSMSDAELNSFTAEYSPKYQKQAERFYAWNDRVLEYVKKSGRLSDEDFKILKEANSSYIPLKKILDEDGSELKVKRKDTLSKKIGSSDLKIDAPLVTMIQNTEAMIKIAEINKAKTDFIKDAVEKGVVKKSDVAFKPTKISKSELKKILADGGVDIDETDLDTATIFRPSKSYLAENQIEVFENGKVKVYDILDENLAKSIKSFENNPYYTDMFFKIGRAATTAFKFGTTGIPDFIIQNSLVDYTNKVLKSTDLSALNKNITDVNIKAIPEAFSNNLAILKSMVQQDKGWYDYLSSKAGGSAWADAESALLKITEGRYDTKEYSEIHSKVRNKIQTAKEFYQASQRVSEHFTRYKTFKEKVNAGESTNKAAIAAKDISVDFSERGYSKALANMNAITAFQNVAIQGTNNFVRSVMENPKIAYNAMAFYTTAAVGLWLANRDDERYEETPEWEKLTYFHIFMDDWQEITNDFEQAEADSLFNLKKHSNSVKEVDGKIYINRGEVLKIKKVPVFGEIFATLPTILLEKFFGDKEQELDEFGKAFFKNALPSVVPNIAVPAFEQFSNTSFFTGSSIVPYRMLKASPELQYTNYTNDSAKALGRIIQATPIVGKAAEALNLSSPAVLDNYIRQWTGQGGVYIMNLASRLTPQSAYKDFDLDQADVSKPASRVTEYPVVKRFFSRIPSQNSDSMVKFEKYYEKYNQLNVDVSLEKQRGNWESFSYLKQKQILEFAPIAGINQAISTQANMINLIQKRSDLNETEKRQLIDSTVWIMIGLSQQGLELIGQFEEQNKE